VKFFLPLSKRVRALFKVLAVRPIALCSLAKLDRTMSREKKPATSFNFVRSLWRESN